MEVHGRVCSSVSPQSEEEMDLRRGPWTVEEDIILMNYIANHGEGRWNSLARCAGLKRTGKSCRLRWLNYLRPDVRRGNITPEEQLLILELHSRWGNRWSKIAQYLPGRTDNEIKNYWRTRVQKHAKQLKCDVNSKQFKDVMRYLWMPRLIERIHANSGSAAAAAAAATQRHLPDLATMVGGDRTAEHCSELGQVEPSMAGSSSESMGTELSPAIAVSDGLNEWYGLQAGDEVVGDGIQADQFGGWCPEMVLRESGYAHQGSLDFEQSVWGECMSENLWDVEDFWSLQQQL